MIILNTNNSLGFNYLASFGTTQGDIGLVADYDKDGFSIGTVITIIAIVLKLILILISFS